jgi:hypothetical protein
MIRHGTIAGADACQGLGFGHTKPWYSWGAFPEVWEAKPLNRQGPPIPLRGAKNAVQWIDLVGVFRKWGNAWNRTAC